MALWNNTTAPKWLLGVDNSLDEGKRGLGNNGIKNNKDIDGNALEDGNELAMADDEKGVGWRIWHSKENGKNIGEGRGWWEILATFDSLTGDEIEMGGPVAAAIADITLTATSIAALPQIVVLSATDPDGTDVTYALGALVNCTATLADASTGVVTIDSILNTADGTATTIKWTASAGGLDSVEQTITIIIDNPA